MSLLRQPVNQLKRIAKPHRRRPVRKRGQHPVVVAAAAAQAGAGGCKCDPWHAYQRSARAGRESFGLERPTEGRFQNSKSAGAQFAQVGYGAEFHPAEIAIDDRVEELAMRAQNVRRDKGGFDLAPERRVENDFDCGEIVRCGQQATLDVR